MCHKGSGYGESIHLEYTQEWCIKNVPQWKWRWGKHSPQEVYVSVDTFGVGDPRLLEGLNYMALHRPKKLNNLSPNKTDSYQIQDCSLNGLAHCSKTGSESSCSPKLVGMLNPRCQKSLINQSAQWPFKILKFLNQNVGFTFLSHGMSGPAVPLSPRYEESDNFTRIIRNNFGARSANRITNSRFGTVRPTK